MKKIILAPHMGAPLKKQLTPQDKLRQKLVHMVTGEKIDDPGEVMGRYDELSGTNELGDARGELRGGQEETGLPCESSRNYESVAVASEMLDGTWVGWTYWYGGGKHGQPELLPWVDHAYDVTFTEEARVVKKFRRASPCS